MAKERTGLKFSSFEGLTKWLVTTKWGEEVIRDVLYSARGERFYQEFVERELCLKEPPQLPTHVLVVAHGDGWIEVYGERHVRVNIVGLPMAGTIEQEIALERFVEANVKYPYREVYFPSNKRATLLTSPLMEFVTFVKLEQYFENERLLFGAVGNLGEQLK